MVANVVQLTVGYVVAAAHYPSTIDILSISLAMLYLLLLL